MQCTHAPYVLPAFRLALGGMLATLALSATSEEIIEAARPASQAEVTALTAEIVRRLAPFTLQEARDGFPQSDAALAVSRRPTDESPAMTMTGTTNAQTVSSVMTLGAATITTESRLRVDAGKTYAIIALVRRTTKLVDDAAINMKEGGFGLIEIMSRSFGQTVIGFIEQVEGQQDPIGYKRTILFDGDVRTEYTLQTDGTRTVRKFRE